MDYRHRPDGPAAPPGGEPAGWVVAREEEGGPPPRGRDQPAPTHDPGYGGARYDGPAEFPEHPDPGYGYPDSGYPDSGYPDAGYPGGGYGGGYREPGISGPGHRSGHHYPRPEPADPGGYPAHPADRRLDPAYPPEPPTRLQPAVRHPDPARPPAEPEPPPTGAWLPALLWTVVLFVVPALLYLGWTLTLSDTAPAGCVDAAGAPCPPPRTEAVDRLVGVLPGLGGALALGLLVALGLRRIAADWRDATVGLAAAVIGAALATLVGTVVS